MSHLKRTIAKCLTALTAVLLLAGMGLSAYAVSDGLQVRLSVSQVFVNHTTKEVEDTFSYVLTPLEAGNPLPENRSDRYSFTAEGTEKVTLEAIAFTRPGIYRYEIQQAVERKITGYTYDQKIYTVEIHVTNAPTGGLNAATVIYQENGEKGEEISFENSYRKVSPTGDNPKTGDNNHPSLLIAILAVSAVGLVVLLVLVRKRNAHSNEDRDGQSSQDHLSE